MQQKHLQFSTKCNTIWNKPAVEQMGRCRVYAMTPSEQLSIGQLWFMLHSLSCLICHEGLVLLGHAEMTVKNELSRFMALTIHLPGLMPNSESYRSTLQDTCWIFSHGCKTDVTDFAFYLTFEVCHITETLKNNLSLYKLASFQYTNYNQFSMLSSKIACA